MKLQAHAESSQSIDIDESPALETQQITAEY